MATLLSAFGDAARAVIARGVGALATIGLIIRPSRTSPITTSPTIRAGQGPAVDDEPNGSLWLGVDQPSPEFRADGAWVALSSSAGGWNYEETWTVASGVTAYTFGSGTVTSGSATTGAPSLLSSLLLANALPQPLSEYSLSSSGLTLSSSPPDLLVGKTLSLRCRRS